MIIKGNHLSARPDAKAVGPHSIFIDLETSQQYVAVDGEWVAYPSVPSESSAPDGVALPDLTAAMQNKLLRVANDGTLEWVAPIPYVPDSTATTVAALRQDFNSFLTTLRECGVMAAPPLAEE